MSRPLSSPADEGSWGSRTIDTGQFPVVGVLRFEPPEQTKSNAFENALAAGKIGLCSIQGIPTGYGTRFELAQKELGRTWVKELLFRYTPDT